MACPQPSLVVRSTSRTLPASRGYPSPSGSPRRMAARSRYLDSGPQARTARSWSPGPTGAPARPPPTRRGCSMTLPTASTGETCTSTQPTATAAPGRPRTPNSPTHMLATPPHRLRRRGRPPARRRRRGGAMASTRGACPALRLAGQVRPIPRLRIVSRHGLRRRQQRLLPRIERALLLARP